MLLAQLCFSTSLEGRGVRQKRVEVLNSTRSRRIYTDVYLPVCLRVECVRLLVSAPPIFKSGGAIFASTSVFKMTASLLSSYDVSEYQYRHGGRWFHAVAMFWLCQNSRSIIDKDVNY